MITNFEEITAELTEEELGMVDTMVSGFNRYTKENPIKAPEIIRSMKSKGYKITEPRLRKIVNHIRVNGIIPLIATSNGYFVTYDKEEIKKQVKSLKQRARSINEAARGMEKWADASFVHP